MTIFSGSMQAVATKKAGKAQAAAANRATDVELQMFEESKEEREPWTEAGRTAINTLMGGPVYAPTRHEQRLKGYEKKASGGYVWDPSSETTVWRDAPEEDDYTKPIFGMEAIPGELLRYEGGLLAKGPGKFEESPGYQIRLREGANTLNRFAASRGTLRSGAQDKALIRYGQDYATNEYDMFLNRYYQSLNPWFTMAGMGQVSVNTGGNQATAVGQSIGQNMMAAGNARASSYINQANAMKGSSNSLSEIYALGKGAGWWGNSGTNWSNQLAIGNTSGDYITAAGWA